MRSDAQVEQELHRIDVSLRELKVKYDQFFAGALEREPLELRQQVERTLQRIAKDPPAKYAMRFHFNALVSRFSSFAELWNKTLRSREEGRQRSPSATERLGLKQRLIMRCTIQDPGASETELRKMHARYQEARERQGQRHVPFERFVRGIAAECRRLRADHDCGPIEVRLVEQGDQVQIRARPGR
jgi:hypothetical protein